MSELPLFIGLFGWLFFSAFFSGAETGFYVISRVRLATAVASEERDALRILHLLKHPSILLGTVLVGTNLSNFAASGFAMKLLELRMPGWSGSVLLAFINTLIMTPIILVCGEMVPKSVFRIRSFSLTRRISLSVLIFHYLFLPVNLVLTGFSKLMNLFISRGRVPRPEILSRRAMETHLLEGHEAGAISLEQDRIARNILGLSELRIGEVMIPLGDAVLISNKISLDEFKAMVSATGFSRYPVYEGRRDNVVGVINVIDVLYSEKPFGIEFHLRQSKNVRADANIDRVLLDMRASRHPLGIVEGQNGRAVGIFTMKDLVEEVVGELREW
ncbi:MAG: CNNM domain-containing protein [Planctomycetota bacterium]